jgi:hypothetical protein
MSKAEERAVEAYPLIDGEMSKTQNANAGRMYARNIFKKGYEQAEKDLTDQARKAVEIAREEIIEKAWKFVKEHFFFEEDSKWMLEGEITKKDKAINDLKQAMKDE